MKKTLPEFNPQIDVTEMKSVLLERKNEALRGGITVWLPQGYKEKYDIIQLQYNKKFSEVLRKLITQAIDKIEV